MSKPDVTFLERLVSQGRLSEALEGYQRLLQSRPDDSMLKALWKAFGKRDCGRRALPAIAPSIATCDGGLTLTASID